MKKITLTNYKTDPCYQRIVAAVTAILAKATKGVVRNPEGEGSVHQ
jgi:hypothetical protein